MRYRKYNQTTNQKLHKEFCEICKTTEKETLHHHHIIERHEIDTSNDPLNLAVLCASCHAKVHASKIRIIGVYPSTAKYGRTLVYEQNGQSNVPGITEPFYRPKRPQSKLYGIDYEEE